MSSSIQVEHSFSGLGRLFVDYVIIFFLFEHFRACKLFIGIGWILWSTD